MVKRQKTKRTQLRELAVSEQELTAEQARQVKGGKAGDPLPEIDVSIEKKTGSGLAGHNQPLKSKHDSAMSSIQNMK